MSVIRQQCYGKVNLFLEVGPKRDDGYHDISTLFYRIGGVVDTIEITLDAPSGICVTSSDASLPSGIDNLAGKAAVAYAEQTGIKPTWHIYIEKHLPVAGGVGGGSSNCGGVLLALNSYYKVLSNDELIGLAARLGADVPFFASGAEMAIGHRRGDLLQCLDNAPAIPLVLAAPGVPISARWAYQNLGNSRKNFTNNSSMLEALGSHDFERVALQMHNDLEPAVFNKFPVLRHIKGQMEEFGAVKAMLSGSGSSVFCVARSHADARRIAHRLANLGIAVWSNEE